MTTPMVDAGGALDEVEKERRRLQKKLMRQVGRAVHDYAMINEGSRVLVCVSGGKDSLVMLDLLLELQQRSPVAFELRALHLDQKQPGYPADVLPRHFASRGVEFEILERDTYTTVIDVVEEGKTMCGLCSRLRRGILYGYASEHGFDRIALGHHADDLLETFFLNLFHGGTVKALPPKLRSDDAANVVIRPLVHCREADIGRYSELVGHEIVPCNLCGSQDHLQRQEIKAMLRQWELSDPNRLGSMLRAMQNVRPSQLADASLFDFERFDLRHP